MIKKTFMRSIKNQRGHKKLLLGILFIIAIFIVQSPVKAQMKNQNTSKTDEGKPDSLNGITIHQVVDLKASPQQVYGLLLSSKEFSACTKKSFDNFSTYSAEIDAIPGGRFSVFDGHIFGRILELVPNQRIVEAWRVVDWPPGVYSIARFELKETAWERR